MNPDIIPTITPVLDPNRLVVVEGQSLDGDNSIEAPKQIVNKKTRIRRRFWVTTFSILVCLLMVIIAMAVNRLQKDQAIEVSNNLFNNAINLPLNGLGLDLQSSLSQIGQLDINGNMRVNGSVLITPSSAPTNPELGQLYVDNITDQLYFYDGTQYQLIVTSGNNTGAANNPNIDLSAYLTRESDPGWLAVSANYFNLNQSEVVIGVPSFNGGTDGAAAPFTVDSTYVVTDLNADLLDGFSASDFTPASGSGNYIQNQNIVVQAADFWISGSGIFETALGVGTNNPTYALEVVSAGDGSGTYDITLPIFSGDGLNDITIGETFTGSTNTDYYVYIDSIGSSGPIFYGEGPNDMTVGGTYTGSGTGSYHVYIDSVSSDAIDFYGEGPNDMTVGGTYTGEELNYFYVYIDSVGDLGDGIPDTFTWGNNEGEYYEVPITGEPQNLSDGVTITFSSTNGHTLYDDWEFRVSPGGSDTFTWGNNEGEYYEVPITGEPQNLSDGVTIIFGSTTGHTLWDEWDFDVNRWGVDTFTWGNAGGGTNNVPITGSNQTLDNGVTIAFESTTGHELNDEWTFSVTSQPKKLFGVKTYNDEYALHVDNTGSVGVGTTDLSGNYKLQVAGNTYLNNSLDNSTLTVNRNYNVYIEWSSGASDVARVGHSAVIYNDKMYVYGGYSDCYLSDLRVYDFATDTWSDGASDVARVGHSAVVYNGKMYVYGGYNDYGPLSDLRIYDFATDTWSDGASDVARYYHSAVVYDDKMYVFGGDDEYYSASYDLRIYDFATDTWSDGASDVARYYHSAVVYDDKMYVFGGVDGYGNTLDDLRIYDFAEDEWYGGTSDSIARSYHSAVVYDDKMYVFGGVDGYGNTLDDLRIYDFAEDEWYGGTSDSIARSYHSAVVYDDKMYIFSGTNNESLSDLRINNLLPPSQLEDQTILAIQENNINTLSFQIGSIMRLDSGKLSLMNGNVGIDIENPSYKLQLAESTIQTDGIGFGEDTALYRSAANTLTTAGNLSVGGNDIDVVAGLTTGVGTTIASELGAWKENAIAEGNDGFARISFYDSLSSNLKYVRCLNENCSEKVVSDVDAAGGAYSISMAIADDGYARIVYSDGAASLRYARCLNNDCSSSTITTVDAGYIYDSSIAIAPDGYPRIIYNEGYSTINYVQCLDDDCATNVITFIASGDISSVSIDVGLDSLARLNYRYGYSSVYVRCMSDDCDSRVATVVTDDVGHAGQYSTMVIAPDGYARILYGTLGDETPNYVSYIQCLDDDCQSRTKTILDDNNTYGYMAIGVAPDGYVRFAYFDNQNVIYAQCFDDSCGAKTSTPIDYSSESQAIDLSIGLNGYPLISYYNSSTRSLKYAHLSSDARSFSQSGDDLAVAGSVAIKDGAFIDGGLAVEGTASFRNSVMIGSNINNINSSIINEEAWGLITLDGDGIGDEYTGTHSSIALGADDFIRISYFDNNNEILKYIQCIDKYCNQYNASTVDSSTGAGYDSSIAIGDDGFARISYYDSTNQDLKFAQCTNDDCSSNVLTTVDNIGNVGRYNALAIAPDGYARISYQDTTNGDLKYIQCTNDDCSTRNITTLDALGSSAGLYSSIAIAPDGYARISYSTSSGQPHGGVKYIRCTNNACSTRNNATLMYDSSHSKTSIAIAPDGYARISYNDSSGGLNYVRCMTDDCGYWDRSIFDLTGYDTGFNSSIIMKEDGFVAISYYDDTYGVKAIKYLECADEDCSVNTITTIIDDLENYSQSDTNPIAINSAGRVYISYCDTVDYKGDLGLAISEYPQKSYFIMNENTSSLFSSGTVGIKGDTFVDSSLAVGGTLNLNSGIMISPQFSFMNENYTQIATLDSDGFKLSGSLGIANTSPGYLLHVGSSSVTSGTAVARFENAGGTCTITPDTAGNITCTSDERLKKDISTYADALNQILGLRTVSYHMLAETETDQLHVGFIAQEYEELFPDLVYTDSEGIKSISYAGLTPYLASAIQQQQKLIEELNTKVATLNNNMQYNSELNLSTITGNLTVTGNIQVANITINGHIISAGETPTITAGIAAGEGSVTEVLGNDTSGTITVTTGDDVSNGSLVELIFKYPFNRQPKVILTAGNTESAELLIYRDANPSKFTINTTLNPEEHTIYIFDYLIVE